MISSATSVVDQTPVRLRIRTYFPVCPERRISNRAYINERAPALGLFAPCSASFRIPALRDLDCVTEIVAAQDEVLQFNDDLFEHLAIQQRDHGSDSEAILSLFP